MRRLSDPGRRAARLPGVAGGHGARLGKIRHAAIAIANPITGDQVRMTNHHWEFSIEAMRLECGFDTLLVVNDFTALARAVAAPVARPEAPGRRRRARAQAAPLGLLGAGTGLGVSGLIPPATAGPRCCSEGGHVTFSPANETEVAILQFAWREFEHVSAERLLSGDGIELIYRALAASHRPAGRAAVGAPKFRAARWPANAPLCDQVIEPSAACSAPWPATWPSRWARRAASISAAASCRAWASASPLAVPHALRAEGPLRQLPGAGADLRDHRRVSGVPRRVAILSEKLGG